MSERPSQYLVEKCQSFHKVLDFFLGPDKERRVSFVSQIGFWEWELDTLIYSVTSFEERSKVWEVMSSAEDALRQQGIVLKRGVLEGTRYNKKMRVKYGTKITAPIATLNEVIERWNQLLDVCENLLPDNLEKAVELGANVLTSLKKYRKKILQTD